MTDGHSLWDPSSVGAHASGEGGADNAIDWPALDDALTRALADTLAPNGDAEAVDDVLDAWLASPALASLRRHPEQLGESGTAWITAGLRAARSELTQRDLALLLAQLGPAADLRVADALDETYRSSRAAEGRRPGLLRALAIYAERSPPARPDLFAALQRTALTDSRYMTVTAAKIIGRFEGLGIATGVRNRLEEWAEAEDLAVRGEALFQLGLLTLRDVLDAESSETVREGLELVLQFLRRAEDAEEHRADAIRLGAAVDLVHACCPRADQREVDWTVVGDRVARLMDVLTMANRPWIGYASRREQVLEYRCVRLADAAQALVPQLASSAVWTNFDAVLIELAAIGRLMWGRATGAGTYEPGSDVAEPDGGHSDAPHDAWITAVSDRVVRAAVGSVLARAVGAERLRQVVHNYRARPDADPALLQSMEHLAAAAADGVPGNAAGTGEARISVEDLLRLAREDIDTASRLVTALPGLQHLYERVGLGGLAQLGPFASPALATDAVDYFGEDPDVDQTCRAIFDAAWPKLEGLLRPAAWQRFVSVVITLVKSARDFRDELPMWARSQAAKGEGRRAVEAHLRDYLHVKLRAAYPSRLTDIEAPGVSGGRADLLLRFPELAVPVEAKREFVDVSREHIRASYLAQPDRYAAARDRVAFLAVLDLRVEPTVASYAMPHLSEIFWVDQLPPDPMITDARPSVIVVGLFRGNRHLPSALSARPSPPRRPPRTP